MLGPKSTTDRQTPAKEGRLLFFKTFSWFLMQRSQPESLGQSQGIPTCPPRPAQAHSDLIFSSRDKLYVSRVWFHFPLLDIIPVCFDNFVFYVVKAEVLKPFEEIFILFVFYFLAFLFSTGKKSPLSFSIVTVFDLWNRVAHKTAPWRKIWWVPGNEQQSYERVNQQEVL